MVEIRDLENIPEQYKEYFNRILNEAFRGAIGGLLMTDVFHLFGTPKKPKIEMDFSLPVDFVINFLQKFEIEFYKKTKITGL